MVDIEAKYSGRTLSMPGKTNIIEAARRARHVEAQDWETAIWAYPLVACINETRPFVQFCITVPVESRTSPHGYSVGKIVGFAHPRALHIACEASRHWFIDGTFFVVPVGFYQLIILMIFIPGYKLAIPIWYILVPDKKGATYHMALGMAQGVSEHYGRMKASTFTCDFEEALIKCLIILFCMGVLVGCLFHLKQAIRGKLTKTFGFDKNDPIVVQVCSKGGMLDLLSVVPYDRFKFAVDYCKNFLVIPQPSQVDILDRFFLYFYKTWWAKKELWARWSLVPVLERSETDPLRHQLLVNKTNAFCERRNRSMNEKFGAHPSMVDFVQFIKHDQQQALDDYDLIQKGKMGKRNVAADPEIPELPPAMKAWITRAKKNADAEAAREARNAGRNATRVAKSLRSSNGEVSQSRATKKK